MEQDVAYPAREADLDGGQQSHAPCLTDHRVCVQSSVLRPPPLKLLHRVCCHRLAAWAGRRGPPHCGVGARAAGARRAALPVPAVWQRASSGAQPRTVPTAPPCIPCALAPPGVWHPGRACRRCRASRIRTCPRAASSRRVRARAECDGRRRAAGARAPGRALPDRAGAAARSGGAMVGVGLGARRRSARV